MFGDLHQPLSRTFALVCKRKLLLLATEHYLLGVYFYVFAECGSMDSLIGSRDSAQESRRSIRVPSRSFCSIGLGRSLVLSESLCFGFRPAVAVVACVLLKKSDMSLCRQCYLRTNQKTSLRISKIFDSKTKNSYIFSRRQENFLCHLCKK